MRMVPTEKIRELAKKRSATAPNDDHKKVITKKKSSSGPSIGGPSVAVRVPTTQVTFTTPRDSTRSDKVEVVAVPSTITRTASLGLPSPTSTTGVLGKVTLTTTSTTPSTSSTPRPAETSSTPRGAESSQRSSTHNTSVSRVRDGGGWIHRVRIGEGDSTLHDPLVT